VVTGLGARRGHIGPFRDRGSLPSGIYAWPRPDLSFGTCWLARFGAAMVLPMVLGKRATPALSGPLFAVTMSRTGESYDRVPRVFF